jgi:hypothetical protein
MTIDELIVRLEAAHEGSRELDWWIWWRAKANVPEDAIPPSKEYREGSIAQGDTPRYTTSIDSALTLTGSYDVVLQTPSRNDATLVHRPQVARHSRLCGATAATDRPSPGAG